MFQAWMPTFGGQAVQIGMPSMVLILSKSPRSSLGERGWSTTAFGNAAALTALPWIRFGARKVVPSNSHWIESFNMSINDA
jgi:hypothetical protein